MPTSLAAPPLQTPIVELSQAPGAFPGQMTKVFADWLRSLVDRAQVAAYAISSISLEDQSASIGLTSLIPSASGLYRVSYRFRIVQMATTSSSVQVTISTTEGGITCTQSSPAYTENLDSEPQSGTFVVNVDPASPLQFSVTYASVGATPALFDLDLIVEQL